MTGNGLPRWAAAEPGRSKLLDDRGRLLALLPDMRLRLRDGNLLWAGPIDHGSLRGALELHYPDDFPVRPRRAELIAEADGLTVKVELTLTDDVDLREQLFLLLQRVRKLPAKRGA